MFSHYQHHATSFANLAIASAHAIVDDLHRQARGLAPRFADETADSGCTNIRPSDDQPRRQQAWDILAEALAWNLIADHVDLVVEAKGLEARNVAYQVGWIYSWDATDANPEGAYVKALDALCVDGTPANVQVAADGTRFVGDPRALEDDEPTILPSGYEEDLDADGSVIVSEQAPWASPAPSATRLKGHQLEITSTGRGAVFGSCTCGVFYKASDNRVHKSHFAPYERPKIRALHQTHLSEAALAASPAPSAAAQAAAEITSASVTTPSREDTAGRTGAGRWLDLIHEVNRIAPGTFGEPISVGRIASTDRYTEVYADATVVIDDDPDGNTTITSTSVQGARLIALAAAKLNLGVSLA